MWILRAVPTFNWTLFIVILWFKYYGSNMKLILAIESEIFNTNVMATAMKSK
jgi:hypothetical protein